MNRQKFAEILGRAKEKLGNLLTSARERLARVKWREAWSGLRAGVTRLGAWLKARARKVGPWLKALAARARATDWRALTRVVVHNLRPSVARAKIREAVEAAIERYQKIDWDHARSRAAQALARARATALSLKTDRQFSPTGRILAPLLTHGETLARAVGRILGRKTSRFYGTLATVALSTYFLADVLTLTLEQLIPDPPPPVADAGAGGGRGADRRIENYGAIIARNLFNSRGLIGGEGVEQEAQPTGAPVRSSLAYNLVGTVIFEEAARSVATLQDRGALKVYAVQAGDEVPSVLRVQQVEPTRVIFLNLSSRRLEFLDLPEDGHRSPTISAAPKPTGGPKKVEQVATRRFVVPRKEIDASLADLNKVLTQARAVPNFENGVANGYKLFQIVPGSVYDQLGLRNGDVITGINGQSINDPAKAFELLSELKNAAHVELTLRRGGRDESYGYDIQ